MSWWRRRSLRARLLIIGVTGLCLGFLLGGVTLLAALGLVLQRSVDADLLRTAREVAGLVDAGELPAPVPVAGSGRVQVLDASGRVRSASIDADPLVSMLAPAELSRARAGEALFVPGERLGLAGPVRVVAVPAGPVDDPQTVVVARSMADALRGIGLLRTTLLVVLPLLVLVLALVAWRVVGATLQPVEALRRGAEEITGAGRPGRLPVPAGADEIHRLAVTLNSMLDRLAAGRARQREFVADAAHELRSPLANMRTQLEVAQRLGGSSAPDQLAPDQWASLCEDLLLDTNRLARLVDDLLLLARADAAVGPLRAEPVELVSLVREVAARYPSVAVSDHGDLLWTLGEREALRRVVANLLDNAVRHAHAVVSVVVRAEPAALVVTVTDDGPGIPAANRERVFERFTRLDDARARDGGGAGLGLAIVRELVARHGGSVTLSDARLDAAAPAAGLGPNPSPGPGLGLRVEIRLPRAAAE